MYQNGNQYGLFLMPLKDVHLSTMLFENREGKRTLTYALVANRFDHHCYGKY